VTRSLVLLARVATPGHGKTRLRQSLPDADVNALTRAFLHDTIEWSEQIEADLIIVRAGPVDALPPTAATLVPQVDGDLGARIDAALSVAFDRGAETAVLIGSDSPDLPERLLLACFTGLEDAETTLIPAADGGWVALGARRRLDGCLRSVRWSTGDTGAETVAALRAAHRPALILEPWYDIDDVDSLDRLRESLENNPERAPRTAQIVATLAP